MKYCQNCGASLNESERFCSKCGEKSGSVASKPQISALKMIAFAMMIVGTISMCSFFLIPLAWCIPMTVVYYQKISNNEPVSTAFKVCTLLFVSLIGGILMLVDTEE